MTIEVPENRTFSGEAAKFQSSDHQTAPIHASLITRRGFPCHSFTPGLALRADPRCKITQRSRKAMVTTPVSQLGRTGNIWFFSWKEEGSHSRTQTAAESRWNSQEYSEVWLLRQWPEAAVISCWLWRCYPSQVLFCGEGYVMWPVGAIKTTSPHACTLEECALKVCGVRSSLLHG